MGAAGDGRSGADAPAPLRHIHERVAASIATTPEAVAVRDGGVRTSYAQLDVLATEAVRLLDEAGVRPGHRVILAMDRSAELFAAELACLRLDAVYVPLDREQPEARTQHMVATVRPTATVRLEEGAFVVDRHEEPGDDGALVAADAACIMFTSGSSGLPKAAVLTEVGILSLLDASAGPLEIGPGTLVGAACHLTWDASIFELWVALTTGATVVVIRPDELLSTRKMASLVAEGLDVLTQSTSVVAFHIENEPTIFNGVRAILQGAEKFRGESIAKAFAAGFDGRMINIYGPTETVVFSTWHEVVAPDAPLRPDGPGQPTISRLLDPRSVPIGGPIVGTTVWLLDADGEEVGPGEVGKICIESPAVALGYLGDPELTASRFIPSPSGGPGRAYRTGDLGRWLSSGVLDFLGRTDRQVQVAGMRIQPEEIELALASLPIVGRAAVVQREVDGDVVLTAAVEAPGATSAEVSAGLAELLPHWMLPSQIVVWDEIPTLANGKMDLSAVAAAVERPRQRARRLAEVVRARAASQPQALAVVDGERTLAYGDLVEQADLLGERLAAHGVGPGRTVALLLERSIEMVVAQLACAGLGGTFVPLDVSQPQVRTDLLLSLVGPVATVRHGDDGVVVEGLDATRAMEDLSDGDLCVLLTSGSTGVPKGVALTQPALAAQIDAVAPFLEAGPGRRSSYSCNVAFDFSIWELWLGLATGMTLVVVDRDALLSTRRLTALLGHHRVDILSMTTSLMSTHLQIDPAALNPVGLLVYGGERSDDQAVRSAFAAGFDGRMINIYGPTEATVFVAWHEISARPALDLPSPGGPSHSHPGDPRPIPVGRPIATVALAVVDEEGGPADEGEVLITGSGVTAGYLGDPGRTAERYATDASGARSYRTGDLGRWTPMGELDIVGRIDRQAKVRGNRIQLEEVELAIEAHPGVRRASVGVEGEGSDRRLVASVEAPGLVEVDLRRFLEERLPSAMVPGTLSVVDVLALNQNGKLARTPDAATTPTATRPTEEASTAVDAQVRQAWFAQLDRDDGDPDTSFFDLGGHSLGAARLLARVEQLTGVDVPVSTFIVMPTLRALQDLVRGVEAAEQEGVLVTIRAGEAPGVLFLHAGSTNLLSYGALLGTMGTRQRLLGLEQDVLRLPDPAPDIEGLARAVFDRLESEGVAPPVLCGYSFAGLMGIELCRLLAEAGTPVDTLIVLDPPTPESYNLRQRLLRRLKSLLGQTGVREDLDPEQVAMLTETYRRANIYRPAPLRGVRRVVVVDALGARTPSRRRRDHRYWRWLFGEEVIVATSPGVHGGSDGFVGPKHVAGVADFLDRMVEPR